MKAVHSSETMVSAYKATQNVAIYVPKLSGVSKQVSSSSSTPDLYSGGNWFDFLLTLDILIADLLWFSLALQASAGVP
jgi:hypothetical protein